MDMTTLDKPVLVRVNVPDYLPPSMYLDDSPPNIPADDNESSNPRLFITAFFRDCECLSLREIKDNVKYDGHRMIFRKRPNLVDAEPTEKDRFISVLYEGVHRTAIKHGYAYPRFFSSREELRELQFNPLKIHGRRVDGKDDIRLEQLIEQVIASSTTQPMKAFAMQFCYSYPMAVPLHAFTTNPFVLDEHFLRSYT